MSLFAFQNHKVPIIPGGGGGIVGHAAPQVAINSTANTSPYPGSVLNCVAGKRVYVIAGGLANTGASGDTAGWSCMLGGVAMSRLHGTVVSGVLATCAIFELDAPASGTLALVLNTGADARGMGAIAWPLDGYDAAAPTAVALTSNDVNNVAAFSWPNAVPVAKAGNVILGACFVKSGATTLLAATGADFSANTQSGTGGFSDYEMGYAYKLQPSVGSVSFNWTWTGDNNVAAGFVEVKST